jgi:hypothetical protein
MSQTETSILDQLFDPIARCLTPEVASRIVSLRASADVQERLDTLSDRCTEGELTAEEAAEYEIYVKAIDFIGILQAKARTILAEVTSR